MSAKRTYEVVEDGFILNTFYAAGATVELYPEQARYDLPPYGTMLREAAPAAADRPAPAKAKKPAVE